MEESIDSEEVSSEAETPQGVPRGRLAALWNQLTLSEISGSLGDLGTFIPLYVAMCRQGSLYATPALFFAGVSNIITGWLWDMPMPVQPMKSIAAVALVEALNRQQVTAAGVWMGIFLVLLSLGAIEWVNRLVPLAVVSGMQVGVGCSLAIKGFHIISDLTWIDNVDCILLAVLCALLSLFFLREPAADENSHIINIDQPEIDHHSRRRREHKHLPAVGLYLFSLGAVIAVLKIFLQDDDDSRISWNSGRSIAVWALQNTSWSDWKMGLLEGALPQLPLSTLNSVISVCCLAQTLYPERRREDDTVISRRHVCLSVGLINLLLCPFGGMPNCHGAGGLAGQHKFGARHGASVIFLGVNKMVLAIALGGALLPFLEAIPSSVLGVMLAIAGHELATTGLLVLVRSTHSTSTPLRNDVAVALLTAAVILGMKKTHYGAIAGWIMHMIYNRKLGACWTRPTESVDYSQVGVQPRDEENSSHESDGGGERNFA